MAVMEMQMFCLSVQKGDFIVGRVFHIIPPVHSRELSDETVKGRLCHYLTHYVYFLRKQFAVVLTLLNSIAFSAIVNRYSARTSSDIVIIDVFSTSFATVQAKIGLSRLDGIPAQEWPVVQCSA